MADEVRKLAARAQEATARIGGILGETKAGIDALSLSAQRATADAAAGMEASREAGGRLAEIDSLARETLGQAEEAAAAVDRMAAETARIEEEIGGVAAITEEHSASSEELAAMAQSITDSAGYVRSAAEDLAKKSRLTRERSERGAAALRWAQAAAERIETAAAGFREKAGAFRLAEDDGGVRSAEPRRALLAAVSAHGKWKLRLRGALEGGGLEVPPEIIATDDHCDFGRWLRSADLPPEIKGSPRYTDVRKTHAEFHRLAGRIAELAVAGRREEAEGMLGIGGEYAEISGRLVTEIMGWLAELGAGEEERESA